MEVALPGNNYVLKKVLLPDESDIIWFNGHGDTFGQIYLRWNSDPNFILGPYVSMGLGDEWLTEVDIVVLWACDTLSLCGSPADSGEPPYSDEEDPLCKVVIGDTVKYDPLTLPNNTNCEPNICELRDCSCNIINASSYGGAAWMRMRKTVNTPTGPQQRGPRLVLGRWASGGTIKKNASLFFDEIQRSVSNDDRNYDTWIQAYLKANLHIYDPQEGYLTEWSNPAAAIMQDHPTNPNRNGYFAILYDSNVEIGQRYTIQDINRDGFPDRVYCFSEGCFERGD